MTKLRASDGTVLGTFSVAGNSPYGIAFDGVNIWVAGDLDVQELRASDGVVIGQFHTSNGPAAGIAFDGANLWVAYTDRNTVGKM